MTSAFLQVTARTLCIKQTAFLSSAFFLLLFIILNKHMTLKHEGQGGGFLYHKCNELIVFYIPLFESHVNDVNTIYGKVMLGNARDHC